MENNALNQNTWRFNILPKTSTLSETANYTIAGFPVDKITGGAYNPMYKDSGKVILAKSGKDEQPLCMYYFDATGGESGAPIYNSSYKVVGMHEYEKKIYLIIMV